MQDPIQPLIHQAPLCRLREAINRTGLSIGDQVELRLAEDGSVWVEAPLRERYWFFPRTRMQIIGMLDPHAADIVKPALRRKDHLRVRIVDILPEHLAPDGQAEVYISVWGAPAPQGRIIVW
ncbi:MAG: hypothetical protein ACK5M4_15940 [Pseudorhodobacter sp.]